MYRLGLERSGFGVTVAADGPVALQLLAERRFDLVLLDIDLPSMDGVELLGKLRRQHCTLGLPVAVLSSLDREEPALARAEELGVLGCLVKSRTVPRALAEHIRVWLRSGGLRPPEPTGSGGQGRTQEE
jgi:CheY-like chemotaxis protein